MVKSYTFAQSTNQAADNSVRKKSLGPSHPHDNSDFFLRHLDCTINAMCQQRKLREAQKIVDERNKLVVAELEKQALEYAVLDLEAEAREKNKEIAELKAALENWKSLVNPVVPYISYNTSSTSIGETDEHGVDKDRIVYGFFCLCGQEFGNKNSFQNHITTATKKKFEFEYEAACGHRRLNGVGYFQMSLSKSKHLGTTPISSAFGCRICRITFSSKDEFKRHRNTVQ